MKLAAITSRPFLQPRFDSGLTRQILLRVLLVTATLAIALSATSLWAQEDRSVDSMTRPRPAEFKRPFLIEFKGEINENLAMYFNRRMSQAKAKKADLLIVEIDSPGGLKHSSLQMARRLRDCDWAYTVVLINNEAISGGALVSLGVDEVHIDPNAKFGDSGEITFDVERWSWRLIEPKVESYLSRDARDLAESKGRSPELAESMIDQDVFVYTQPSDLADGGLEFEAVRADADFKPNPPWKLVPESGAERFLTLSGKRTVELGLAQGFASTREKIAAELGFEVNEITVFSPTLTDAFVYYLNTGVATFLLVVIGLIALYFELSAPGLGIGGLVSGLCAVLFFWSHVLGGTAGMLEVVLFLAGIAFVAAEVFVIPGFGVSGVTGLLLLFASLILAGQDFVIPQTEAQWAQSINSMGLAAISGVAFLGAAVFITKRLGKLPVLNQIVLQTEPETEEDAAKAGAVVHPDVSEGDWGRAETVLRPAGRAKFGDRMFDVVSDGTFIEVGRQVRVVDISGNIITVAEVEAEK